MPPGFQPPQIRRSRKCQTSHALPQRQKAVVHPCVGEAEQVRGEGRQHRRASRESLDCAMALQDLERMGVSNIITFDAHDPRVQNAIPTGGF